MALSRQRRVLLVDDDERVLFVLQAGLQRMEAAPDVVTARDGIAACELLRRGGFDLLITDLLLPGADGITLTRVARVCVPAIPVLWITAHGCAAAQDSARELGVLDCLEKPVEMAEFRLAVRRALVLSAYR